MEYWEWNNIHFQINTWISHLISRQVCFDKANVRVTDKLLKPLGMFTPKYCCPNYERFA